MDFFIYIFQNKIVLIKKNHIDTNEYIGYLISKSQKTKCSDLKNSSSQKIFKLPRKKFHHL